MSGHPPDRGPQDPSTTQVSGSIVQVSPNADLVVVPTPQQRALGLRRSAVVVVAPTARDRALVPAERSRCGCRPARDSVAGHLDSCPIRG